MPDGMRLRPAFAKIGRDLGSKMVHPAAYRLIGNHDSAFRQQILNVAEAQGEPAIKPDRVVWGFVCQVIAPPDFFRFKWSLAAVNTFRRSEGSPPSRATLAPRPCIRLDPCWIPTMKQPFASAARLRGGGPILVWGFVCQAIAPPDFFRFK